MAPARERPGRHGLPGHPQRNLHADTAAGGELPVIPYPLPRLDPILGALADSERHFRTLIELAADGILMADSGGRVTLANPRACEMTGYAADEILGLDVLCTYVPGDRDLGHERLREMPAGTVLRFERELLRKDGTLLPIEASVAWLPGGERQSIMRDVSVRKRTEEHLLAEERRLRAAVRLSELVAPSVGVLLEATLEEVVALSGSAYGYIYYYDEDTEAFELQAWSHDVMAACRVASPARDCKLAETGLWGDAVRQRRPIVVNDFAAPNERKRGYPEGHARLTRFMTVPVLSRGRIVAVVGVANKPSDYSVSDVSQLSQMMDVVWKIADRQRAEDELRRLADELECRVDERTRAFEHANAELESTNTELQRLLREQERLQGELAYRAMHDPLTGLANRMMFGERLEHAIRVAERGAAVVWIDLDHFKEVNDIFGHDVGDEMLVAVADRLRDVVRETDDIARMGGDEFAVILPNVIDTEAQIVAERILAALTDRDAFRLQVGASVGVAWQRPVGGDGPTLVRRADQAMYRAKAIGGGTTVMS
jgi:diguanylate cyclase (GGDEF)-like protein/PAS domain S-box-containing protein